MGRSARRQVVNELPRIPGDVVGYLSKGRVDVAAQYVVRTHIFKGNKVMVEVRAHKDLDGFMVVEVCGKDEDAIVNISFQEYTCEI